MKKILITGGLGFIGVNTALYLSERGYKCHIIDNYYRVESKNNLHLIENNKNISFEEIDITNEASITNIIKNNSFFAILNFAGQVAMSKSLENPIQDFLINAFGSLCILNAINLYSKDTFYLYTSTNKVYGDLRWDELNESETRFESTDFTTGYNTDTPLDITTPYGCSKGTGDLYAYDFFKIFELRTTVFRLSTVCGTNQTSTYDQGWVGWYINEAIKKKNNESINILGTGKQVRDILFIDDFVKLVEIYLKNSKSFVGKKFNVGGGYKNSLSILELINFLEKNLGKKFKLNHQDERLSDQRYYVSNISSLDSEYNWKPTVDLDKGLLEFIDFVKTKNE
tara:strand:- start:519 stop:1538 length:1020 start_codon:yes stop_codon:yes gene_type:complete